MNRTATLEWTAVAVLLLGCASVTAGVIAIPLAGHISPYLIIAGAVVALIGALWWTAVVKTAARRSRQAA